MWMNPVVVDMIALVGFAVASMIIFSPYLAYYRLIIQSSSLSTLSTFITKASPSQKNFWLFPKYSFIYFYFDNQNENPLYSISLVIVPNNPFLSFENPNPARTASLKISSTNFRYSGLQSGGLFGCGAGFGSGLEILLGKSTSIPVFLISSNAMETVPSFTSSSANLFKIVSL